MTYLSQFNFIPKSFTIKKVFEDFTLDFESFIDLFEEFGSLKNQQIKKLSCGEKRLIEMYIIVKSKSKFSMLDEPFSNLNPIQIEKVKTLLNHEKLNKGILVTDHLYRHILNLSDNLYVLKNGKTNLTKNIEDIQRLGYLSKINL